MIEQYILNQPKLTLESDLAGELPIYIYWSSEKETLIYSKSITELLDDSRVQKPLKVSEEGLSFLLQSGVVPPPKTVYKNIYILGIGDKATVLTRNRKIEIDFTHNFPFMNSHRLPPGKMEPNEELILKMLAEAAISRIDNSKLSFLFHSAGKDSNSIALALAEAGWQDKVTLITHKSKGPADESEISAQISKKLGFKHRILHEVDTLQPEHYKEIEGYSFNAPFPCVDNVTLAYPLYLQQLPELKGANIIDGGGNDSHMCTPPTQRELKTLTLSKLAHHFSFLRNFVNTESLLSPLLRTPPEWCGMYGLSYSDTKKLIPNATNVYSHWRKEARHRKDWDFFDFKTSILTGVVASELHIRKVRNFSDSIKSNFVLPFANPNVAKYFGAMPEEYLFDRKSLKNKLILRNILKKRNIVDSDLIGKKGYIYDCRSLLVNNWSYMIKEIEGCKYFDQNQLKKIICRLKYTMDSKHRFSNFSSWQIYKIYLISAWLNNNRYIN